MCANVWEKEWKKDEFETSFSQVNDNAESIICTQKIRTGNGFAMQKAMQYKQLDCFTYNKTDERTKERMQERKL